MTRFALRADIYKLEKVTEQFSRHMNSSYGTTATPRSLGSEPNRKLPTSVGAKNIISVENIYSIHYYIHIYNII